MAGNLGSSIYRYFKPNKYGFSANDLRIAVWDKTFTYHKDIVKVRRQGMKYISIAIIPTICLALVIVYALMSITIGTINVSSINRDNHSIISQYSNIGFNVAYNSITNTYESSLTNFALGALILCCVSLAFSGIKFTLKRLMVNFDKYKDKPYYQNYLELIAENEDKDLKWLRRSNLAAYITFGLFVVSCILSIVFIVLPIDINDWCMNGKQQFVWYVITESTSDTNLHVVNVAAIVFILLTVILEIANTSLYAQNYNLRFIPFISSLMFLYEDEKRSKLNIVYENNENSTQSNETE